MAKISHFFGIYFRLHSRKVENGIFSDEIYETCNQKSGASIKFILLKTNHHVDHPATHVIISLLSCHQYRMYANAMQ